MQCWLAPPDKPEGSLITRYLFDYFVIHFTRHISNRPFMRLSPGKTEQAVKIAGVCYLNINEQRHIGRNKLKRAGIKFVIYWAKRIASHNKFFSSP